MQRRNLSGQGRAPQAMQEPLANTERKLDLGMKLNYMKDFRVLKSKQELRKGYLLEKEGYKALVCDEEAQGHQ